MSFSFFRAIVAAAAVVLIVPAMVADPAYLTPTSSRYDQLSVVELDLTGVRADAVTDLPSPDAVPPEDGSAAPTQPDTSVANAGVDSGTSQETPASGLAEAVIQQAALTVVRTGKNANRRPDPDVLTPKLSTTPFTVLGVTWNLTDGLGDVVIRYRVRESGTWTRWSGVTASDVAPDPGTAEAKAGSRGGTDPIVAVGADGLQVWAEASSGTLSGIKAVLIDPGADPVGVNAANASFQAAVTAPAKPSIISRAGWGANESLRNCPPTYSTGMAAAAVHHTASANGYAAGAVAGIIRGFYAFHTRAAAAGGRGWCDIGYNFFVDRFGRTFEGRAGGITRTVVGAHTGGFNNRTIGVAAIGNFATGAAPAPMVESISRLIAWKFSVHRIVAGASVRMTSAGGASKFPAGTVVTFSTIYGHRDAGLTACPGQNLYTRLPAIRSRVANLANAPVPRSPIGSLDRVSTTPASITVGGWALDPDTTAPITVHVYLDGKATRALTANTARPDVGRIYGKGANHGFAGTVPAARGTHRLCLYLINQPRGANPLLTCRAVATG